jgi:hypothetical protein
MNQYLSPDPFPSIPEFLLSVVTTRTFFNRFPLQNVPMNNPRCMALCYPVVEQLFFIVTQYG